MTKVHGKPLIYSSRKYPRSRFSSLGRLKWILTLALNAEQLSRYCDTVIVTGCTTSGCVRASVVDALQYGYRPIVPLEAVGDRSLEAHKANLFDIEAKYGDVVTLNEVIEYLSDLPTHSTMQ